MDELTAVTTILHDRELEALKFFKAKADECAAQHLAWEDGGEHFWRLEGCDVQMDRREFMERHPALEALATLGFVSFRKTGDERIRVRYHITLLPSAYCRLDYEDAGRLQKLWQVQRLKLPETLGVLGFLVSLVLAVNEIL